MRVEQRRCTSCRLACPLHTSFAESCCSLPLLSKLQPKMTRCSLTDDDDDDDDRDDGRVDSDDSQGAKGGDGNQQGEDRCSFCHCRCFYCCRRTRLTERRSRPFGNDTTRQRLPPKLEHLLGRAVSMDVGGENRITTSHRPRPDDCSDDT